MPGFGTSSVGNCFTKIRTQGAANDDVEHEAEEHAEAPEEELATSSGMALETIEYKGWRTSYRKLTPEIYNLGATLMKLWKKRQHFIHLDLPPAMRAMTTEYREQSVTLYDGGRKMRCKAEDDFWRKQRSIS